MPPWPWLGVKRLVARGHARAIICYFLVIVHASETGKLSLSGIYRHRSLGRTRSSRLNSSISFPYFIKPLLLTGTYISLLHACMQGNTTRMELEAGGWSSKVMNTMRDTGCSNAACVTTTACYAFPPHDAFAAYRHCFCVVARRLPSCYRY